MIGRLLCALGFHLWGQVEWDRRRWLCVKRCTRPGCDGCQVQ